MQKSGDNTHTNCCGRCQNIATHSGVRCAKPQLDFYHDTVGSMCDNISNTTTMATTVATSVAARLFNFQ